MNHRKKRYKNENGKYVVFNAEKLKYTINSNLMSMCKAISRDEYLMELADKVSCGYDTLSEWIEGKSAPQDIELVHRLELALDKPMNYLLDSKWVRPIEKVVLYKGLKCTLHKSYLTEDDGPLVRIYSGADVRKAVELGFECAGYPDEMVEYISEEKYNDLRKSWKPMMIKRWVLRTVILSIIGVIGAVILCYGIKMCVGTESYKKEWKSFKRSAKEANAVIYDINKRDRSLLGSDYNVYVNYMDNVGTIHCAMLVYWGDDLEVGDKLSIYYDESNPEKTMGPPDYLLDPENIGAFVCVFCGIDILLLCLVFSTHSRFSLRQILSQED